MIDRSTRWLEALPVKDLEAATAADALVSGWISRFGVPADITSDRGTQFCSQVWRALCEKLHITHHTTTAYHPASNGMVERAHRQVKEALRARAAQNDWPAHLPWVLLGLRVAPKEDSGVSSAEMVYGARLNIPGQFLLDEEVSGDQCCGSGMIFFGSVSGSGSDFSESFGSDSGSGSCVIYKIN
jgi:hypothetical protein